MRIPLVVSGEAAEIDHDCPLCRMMAEHAGPMFWHLDGHHLDDEFAFSFYRTHEEGELERPDWRTSAQPHAEVNQTAHGEGGPPTEQVAEGSSVWQRSGSFWEGHGELPPGLRVMSFAGHLAELICDLKQSSAESAAPLVSSLNRCFGNLREAIADSSACLIDPVIARFRQDLDEVAVLVPAAAEKVADLQRQLDGLAQCFASEPVPNESWRESDDGD